MIRVLVFLAAVLAAAMGLSWLSDNPGTVNIYWPALNLQANPSVFQVIIALVLLTGLSVLLWALIRQLWTSPAALGNLMNRRRQQRGLDSLSSGMIAIGAGDRDSAMRYAIQARKSLPNEPLTHLLRAQAAQLSGDKTTSRRIFEAMLASPDTEQLGLRGLFVEAQRENETEAARQFAARALKLNSKLAWASTALFDIQCKANDWEGALETLAVARRNNHIEKPLADRRRAVLLTGLALAAEDADPAKALQLAGEAHGLAPDLIPAANLAGRLLASRGNTPKAAKIIQKTWSRSPHPDLATAYAFARIGDSPRDRLERIKQLARLNPHSPESAIAITNAAIDAKDFAEARAALEPLTENGSLTQRVATLMARIESEEHGDKGRVREWLARAVNAPRDPAWTADGIVSETWAPVSPVTGQLDAFQWRVPVENAVAPDSELLSRRVEELVALGAPAGNGKADLADDAKVIDATAEAVATKTIRPSTATAQPEAKPAAPEVAPAAKAAAPTEPAKPAAPASPTPVAQAKAVDKPAAAAEAEVKTTPAPVVEVVPPAPVKPAAEASSSSKPATPAEPIKPVAPVAEVKMQPAPQPVKPPAQTVTAAKPAPAKPAPGKEPRSFVPDDPGTDDPGSSDAAPAIKGVRPPYRAVP